MSEKLSSQDKIDYDNMIRKQREKNNDKNVIDDEKFIIDSFLHSINIDSSNYHLLDKSLKKRIMNLYKNGVFPIRLGGLE